MTESDAARHSTSELAGRQAGHAGDAHTPAASSAAAAVHFIERYERP